MKAFLITSLLTLVSGSAFADQWVRGHIRDNGTYVNPYTRSTPNNTIYDNKSYTAPTYNRPVQPTQPFDYNSAFKNHNDSMQRMKSRWDND